MKIYTKTGDAGTTSLVGGTRVSKADLRLVAYGTADELQAHISYLHDLIARDDRCTDLLSVERGELRTIVADLMGVEAWLASDGKSRKILPAFGPERTKMLERAVDRMSSQLPEVKYFTLTTGDPLFSYSHICRTVARRTERCAVRVAEKEEVPEEVMRYINRLSDYLYVLGRYICLRLGVEETAWIPARTDNGMRK